MADDRQAMSDGTQDVELPTLSAPIKAGNLTTAQVASTLARFGMDTRLYQIELWMIEREDQLREATRRLNALLEDVELAQPDYAQVTQERDALRAALRELKDYFDGKRKLTDYCDIEKIVEAALATAPASPAATANAAATEGK